MIGRVFVLVVSISLALVACIDIGKSRWENLIISSIRSEKKIACIESLEYNIVETRYNFKGYIVKTKLSDLSDFRAVNYSDSCGFSESDSLIIDNVGYSLTKLCTPDDTSQNRRFSLSSVVVDSSVAESPLIIWLFLENDRSTSRPTTYALLQSFRNGELGRPTFLYSSFAFSHDWVSRAGRDSVVVKPLEFPPPGSNESIRKVRPKHVPF